MDVRAALGAGWKRLARDLLLESVLLGLAGGAFGLALAYSALRTLIKFGPQHLPRLYEIEIDPVALVFALAISLFASVAFRTYPRLEVCSSSFL